MGKSLWIQQIKLTDYGLKNFYERIIAKKTSALIIILWRQNFTGVEKSFQDLFSNDAEIKKKYKPKNEQTKKKTSKSEKHFERLLEYKPKNVSVCL